MLRSFTALAILAVAVLAWFVLRGPTPTKESAVRSTVVLRESHEGGVALTPNEPSTGRIETAPGPGATVDEPASAATDVEDVVGLVVCVETSDGEPLAGAPISVEWRKGFGDYGEDVGATDAGGLFRTTVARAFELEGIGLEHADFPGGLHAPLTDFSVDPRAPGVVRVRVPARQRVVVRIVDSGGRPQPGETLLVDRDFALGDDPYVHVLASSQAPDVPPTDASGTVELDLELGFWSFDVMGRRGVPYDQRVTLDRPGRTEQVLLRVLQEDGGRLVHVDVRRSDRSRPLSVHATGTIDVPGMETRAHGTATSAGDDSFDVPIPPVGTWSIVASCSGYERVEIPVRPATRDLTITMVPSKEKPPPLRIAGRVVSAVDGQPLRASVTMPTSASLTSRASGPNTMADGTFDRERPTHRSFYLRADAEGFAPGWVGPITAGDGGPFELRLFPALRVAGCVRDREGNPVDCWVRLYRSSEQLAAVDAAHAAAPSPSLWDSAHTGPTGIFRFEGVTPGTQRLWVEPSDTSQPPALLDVIGGDEDVLVILGDGLTGRGSLRGRVTDATTGRPIAHVDVDLRGGPGESGEGTRGVTDSDGRYVLYGVVPGPFEVVIAPAPETGLEFAHRSIPEFHVSPGENVLDVELRPARRLHLLARAPDGTPAADGALRAFDEAGTPVSLLDRYGQDDGRLESLDAGGRASLFGLPAGIVTLRIWRDEESEENGNTPAGTFEIDLTDPRRELFELRLER